MDLSVIHLKSRNGSPISGGSRTPRQWRIYIQKIMAPPPKRTQFIHFYIRFYWKVLTSDVSASLHSHPPTRVAPPMAKSQIRPCRISHWRTPNFQKWGSWNITAAIVFEIRVTLIFMWILQCHVLDPHGCALYGIALMRQHSNVGYVCVFNGIALEYITEDIILWNNPQIVK